MKAAVEILDLCGISLFPELDVGACIIVGLGAVQDGAQSHFHNVTQLRTETRIGVFEKRLVPQL